MQEQTLASLIAWHRRKAGLSQMELAAGRTTWARMMPVLRALNLRLEPQGPLVDEWKAETIREVES